MLCLFWKPDASAQSLSWIPTGDQWRFFRGTKEASIPDNTEWRKQNFNESAWESAPLPLFYGEPLNGTSLSDMANRYSTLFLRHSFVASDPTDVKSLVLKVQVDDGFIAWINGVEVARLGAPTEDPLFNSLASQNAAEPVQLEDYTIGVPQSVLKLGTNVLAIQVFNVNLTSRDIVIDAGLDATIDSDPPRLARLLPAEGAVLSHLDSVEILFTEAVRGVKASHLQIDGISAASVTQIAPDQYLFTFPPRPSGIATFTLSGGSTLTDLSAASRLFTTSTWSYSIDATAPVPGVTISEFLAVNERGWRDDDGDRSDWIELFNSSTAAVPLAGWALVDGSATWRFPNVTLAANSRLLVYASGKNRTNTTAALHTNFRLDNAGERLALLAPSGAVAYQYTPLFPRQRPDVSYGHVEGAPNRQGYFTVPTPGQPNSTRGEGFAPDIEFSRSGGTYPSGVLDLALRLATVTPTVTNASIRYTLDGSIPTERSLLYSEPLFFTNTAVQIRARAFAEPLLPGTLHSEAFMPLSAPLVAFRSDLPILLIHDYNRGRPPANSRVFATVQLFEPSTNGFTSLTNAPSLSARAGISVRGSSTEGGAKASYRLEIRDEFDNDRAVPLLGMPPDGDWILYAPNNFEPVLIHNPLMHQLSRDIGRYSPRTRFVEVYFIGSGTSSIQQASYSGIYVLEERIEIGSQRVDAGSLQPQNLTVPSVTGGYMLKVDRLDPGDSGLSVANQGIGFVEPSEFELKQSARAPQLAYLRGYMTSFANALYSDSIFKNPTNGFRAFIHTSSWIDHHLLNVLSFNVDALRLSAYFYKERSGLLHFGPLWDFDRALNSTDGRDSNPRVWRSQTSDRGTDFFNYTWWDRLFLNLDFFQDYIDRYQELRQSHFSTTNLWRLIDQMANKVRSAQPREQSRWGVTPRGGSYQAEVNLMRTWISNRTDFMDRQFVLPPKIAAPGGSIPTDFSTRITPPNGANVYYTLNGSDPRLPGGKTNPAAILYSGEPIQISGNAKLVARSVNPAHIALTGANNPPLKSTWSGPVSATYVVDPIPIQITEIHYHPDDGIAAGDADNLEFIELLNRGTQPLSLVGMRLRGGIDFNWTPTNRAILEPGQRGVLVRNLARFTSTYSSAIPILGVYTGNQLANDGERIALFGPLDEPIFDFRYDPLWHPLTDGGGFSMVSSNETQPGPLDLASSWRRSSFVGGSPGRPDATPTYTPAPLTVSLLNPMALRFRFTSPAGTRHLLQETPLLESGSWNLLSSFDGTKTNTIQEFEVPTPQATRFFRLLRY